MRALAVAAVLLFHTGAVPGGFLGVDLFFALSGYLITGQLLREVRTTGGVSLAGFWARRLRRLLPALTTVLVVITAVVWWIGSADLRRTTRADGPWVQFDLQNWHLLAVSASYWDGQGDHRVFQHLWSIAVEEQFYLLWPVVVIAVIGVRNPRGRTDRIAWTTALLSVFSLVEMAVLFDPADPTRVYTGTDTRAFSLLVGAFAATPRARGVVARMPPRAASVTAAVLLLGLVISWVLAEGDGAAWLYRGGLGLYAVGTTLLVALCVRFPGTATARLLAVGPLRWVGSISYSLYLWHWPVVVLLPPSLLGVDGWGWTGVVASVSTALAAITTATIEPLVRYRTPWARGRRGVFLLLVVTVLVAAMWWALPLPEAPAIDVSRLG